MPRTPRPLRSLRGISLIETSILCLILAILLSQAIPSMRQLKNSYQVQGFAQTLMTDLQEARSAAVRQGQAMHLGFSHGDGGSCYIVYGGKRDACECNGEGRALCQDSGVLVKTEWLPSKQAIILRANVEKLSFHPRQGAVTSTGSIDISRPGGPSVRHVVAITGRVRSCSPDGSLGRLPRCTR